MRYRVPLAALALLAASMPWAAGVASAHPASAAPLQYDAFWRQSTLADFRAWSGIGVGVAGSESAPVLSLVPGSPHRAFCASGQIDGGSARYDRTVGLCQGKDTRPSGDQGHVIAYYDGGSFFFGTVMSPIHHPEEPIDHVIASWNAVTPPGTWLEVRVRALESLGWTHWYSLGVWAADAGTIHRHSVRHQGTAGCGVHVDTFHTSTGRLASAYQVGVTLFTTRAGVSPLLRSIAIIASRDALRFADIPSDRSVWGKDLSVPPRSQMLPGYRGLGYGGGGDVWCSPTSVSMVMAYWARVRHQPAWIRTVPQSAQGTYDWSDNGTGNWPFNIAYAARFGLTGFVTRMQSMSQVETWISAGVPIIISIAYGRGELRGAPFAATSGHLIVVRGFTRSGEVIANDPGALTDPGARIIYPRAALERLWMAHSHGVAYVLYPPGWPIPSSDSRGSW